MKKIILIAILAALVWYMWPSKKENILNVGNSGTEIVAFGDSLTYGYGAPRGQDYPTVLSEKLGRQITNMGRNGETAIHAATRVDEALKNRPYMVLIEFGANDFMQSLSFEQTLQAMEKMVDAVQAAGAVAVVVDTGGPELMHRYSKAYKKIAQQKGAVFVPGILDGFWGKRALMSDQIHPNADGYKIVADRIENAIRPYL